MKIKKKSMLPHQLKAMGIAFTDNYENDPNDHTLTIAPDDVEKYEAWVKEKEAFKAEEEKHRIEKLEQHPDRDKMMDLEPDAPLYREIVLDAKKQKDGLFTLQVKNRWHNALFFKVGMFTKKEQDEISRRKYWTLEDVPFDVLPAYFKEKFTS